MHLLEANPEAVRQALRDGNMDAIRKAIREAIEREDCELQNNPDAPLHRASGSDFRYADTPEKRAQVNALRFSTMDEVAQREAWLTLQAEFLLETWRREQGVLTKLR